MSKTDVVMGLLEEAMRDFGARRLLAVTRDVGQSVEDGDGFWHLRSRSSATSEGG